MLLWGPQGWLQGYLAGAPADVGVELHMSGRLQSLGLAGSDGSLPGWEWWVVDCLGICAWVVVRYTPHCWYQG